MSALEIGIASLAGIFALIYAGLWIPFALLICSFIGVWMIKGSPVLAGKLMALAAHSAISSDTFAVIPLFILMGYLVGAAGMGKDAFELGARAFGKLPGGSAVGLVGANAIFAALTGVSVASAAVFTKISLGPLRAAGYRAQFVLGLIAGSSVLGMLIPPSLLLILFGILAEQSVADLFVAGLVPGVILAVLLALQVTVTARYFPKLVWETSLVTPPPTAEAVQPNPLPLVVTAGAVLGGIIFGVFTTSEAAAFGCLLTFLIMVWRQRATKSRLSEVLSDTASITASLCFMIISAQIYARMLALSGVTSELAAVMEIYQLTPLTFVLLYAVLLIALGTILDSASVMILVVPITLPLAQSLGLDLVWLGVITVIAIEIGLLTPPFGMAVFAVKSTLEDDAIPIGHIFRAALPFAVTALVALGLIIAFPNLTNILTF